MRKLIIDSNAADDLFFWAKNDAKTLAKIFSLIENILRNPFEGLGKPEPLKNDLKGYWSRRINDSDRLVYKITEEHLIIISCRFHY